VTGVSAPTLAELIPQRAAAATTARPERLKLVDTLPRDASLPGASSSRDFS
jgi:hypothetical protein